MTTETRPNGFLDHFGASSTRHELDETKPVVVIHGPQGVFSPDLSYFRTNLAILPCRFQDQDFSFITFRLPRQNGFTGKQTRFVNWKDVDAQEANRIADRFRQDLPVLVGPVVKIDGDSETIKVDLENQTRRTLFVPLYNRLNIQFGPALDSI